MPVTSEIESREQADQWDALDHQVCGCPRDCNCPRCLAEAVEDERG